MGQKQLTKAEDRVPMKKVGGLWHGLATSQKQTGDGKPHWDTRYMKEKCL